MKGLSEMRYAQEYGGQKLHLVNEYTDGSVDSRALCGRTPAKRGTWRATFNLPLGHACKRCCQIYDQRYPPQQVDVDAFERTFKAAIGISQNLQALNEQEPR